MFQHARANLLLTLWLACFWLHDEGTGVWVTIVGGRSLPDAITSHPSIK